MDGFPLVGLACENCAHVEWFLAGPMGLRPEEGIPAEAAEGAEGE